MPEHQIVTNKKRVIGTGGGRDGGPGVVQARTKLPLNCQGTQFC